MYRVKIGFNVKMEHGEHLAMGAGKVMDVNMDGGEWKEARFEPGEKMKRLPKLADVKFLLECGALEVVNE